MYFFQKNIILGYVLLLKFSKKFESIGIVSNKTAHFGVVKWIFLITTIKRAVGKCIYREILEIDQLEESARFEHILIFPRIKESSLHYVNGLYRSIKGNIEYWYKKRKTEGMRVKTPMFSKKIFVKC